MPDKHTSLNWTTYQIVVLWLLIANLGSIWFIALLYSYHVVP